MAPGRRGWLASAVAAGLALRWPTVHGSGPMHPQARWMAEAMRMRVLAESWGDPSYGAVIVTHDGLLIGLGPSRVVRDRDNDAHAERVAIRDALQRHGADALKGAVLYGTSRACSACERAAASAGIARMIHGESLHDAGAPRAAQR